MTEKQFLNADDVAQIMTISKAKAYQIIKKLNVELSDMGFITISGKISKSYFAKKIYIDTEMLEVPNASL